MNTVAQKLVINFVEYLDENMDIPIKRGDINDYAVVPQVAVSLTGGEREENIPGHYRFSIDFVLVVNGYDDDDNGNQDDYEAQLETLLTDANLYDFVNSPTISRPGVFLYEIFLNGTSLDYADDNNVITISSECVARCD